MTSGWLPEASAYVESGFPATRHLLQAVVDVRNYRTRLRPTRPAPNTVPSTSPPSAVNWILSWDCLIHSTSDRPTCSMSARTAHSQTTPTLQPASSSLATEATSRVRFCRSLFLQNSGFDLGNRKYGQPAWACQKHPWTNTAAFHLGRTRSGRPGSPLECRRYRKPACHRYFLTSISGRVSALRMRDMRAERVSGLITSVI